MAKSQSAKAKHPLSHVLELNKDPSKGLKEKPVTNPQAKNVRVFAKGGAVKMAEGGKKDMSQDKAMLARHNKLMHPGQKSKLKNGGMVKKAEGGKIKGTKKVLGTKAEAMKLKMLGTALKAKADMAAPSMPMRRPMAPPAGLGVPMKRGGKAKKKC